MNTHSVLLTCEPRVYWLSPIERVRHHDIARARAAAQEVNYPWIIACCTIELGVHKHASGLLGLDLDVATMHDVSFVHWPLSSTPNVDVFFARIAFRRSGLVVNMLLDKHETTERFWHAFADNAETVKP